jgi:hypothetical protein
MQTAITQTAARRREQRTIVVGTVICHPRKKK